MDVCPPIVGGVCLFFHLSCDLMWPFRGKGELNVGVWLSEFNRSVVVGVAAIALFYSWPHYVLDLM